MKSVVTRWIALMLALIMCLGVLPVSAMAEGEEAADEPVLDSTEGTESEDPDEPVGQTETEAGEDPSAPSDDMSDEAGEESSQITEPAEQTEGESAVEPMRQLSVNAGAMLMSSSELNGISVQLIGSSGEVALTPYSDGENQAIISALNGNVYDPVMTVEISGYDGAESVRGLVSCDSFKGNDALFYRVVRIISSNEAEVVSTPGIYNDKLFYFDVTDNGTYQLVRLKGVELDNSVSHGSPAYYAEFVSGATLTGDDLVWTADNPASGHRFVYRVSYRFTVFSPQEPGEIRFVIPEQILRDRGGSFADKIELSVPSKEETETYDEFAEGVFFAWRYEEDGEGNPTGNIILYNFRPIEDGTRSGYIELAYIMTKSTLEYLDYDPENPAANRSDDFHAELYLPYKEKIDSEHIPVNINTTAVITGTEKYNISFGTRWDDSWGNQADFGITGGEDCKYLVWAVKSYLNGTQPYAFTLQDIPVSEGLEVIGIKFGGESKFTPVGSGESRTVENQRSNIRWDYVLTRVTGDVYTEQISGTEMTKWSVTNSAIATAIPYDRIDPKTTATARASFTYEKPVFYDPVGQFYSWKRGDGSTRGGLGPFAYTYGGEVFWPLSFTAGYYSRYDLDQFGTHNGRRGALETYDGLDYAVWMWGAPYVLTKDWSLYREEDKNNGYFREYVIYDQWDTDVRLGHSASDVIEIGADDYRIKSLQFNAVYGDAVLNTETKRFDGRTGTYDVKLDENDEFGGIGDVLHIYGERADGEWVKLAWKDYKEGGESWVNEEYAELEGYKLALKESEDHSHDIIHYRIVMKSRHASVSIGAVPEYELYPSEKVLSIVDEAGTLCLYNSAYADLYSTWEGQTKNVRFDGEGNVTGYYYSGEDLRGNPWNLDLEDGDTRNYYRYFRILDRHDYDYARMSQSDSTIEKRITGTGNDRRMARCVVAWQVDMTETITSSANTAIMVEDVPQNGGVFYDLLPKGATLDKKTVRVMSNRYTPVEFSIELIPNWRNSGRTLMKVIVKTPGTNYSLSYETNHSWASILEYGNNVYNPVAYESGNDRIANGNADDASGILWGTEEEITWMSGFDPECGEDERFIYAQATTSIGSLMATSVGTSKQVRALSETTYRGSAFVNQQGIYVYKLTYAPDTVTKAKNILFIDNLENSNEAGRQWQGKLYSADPEHPENAIDVRQMKGVGADPTVYLSDHVVEPTFYGEDQSVTEYLAEKGFVEMSEFFESHSLEEAKAVAIYCGDSFEMKGTKEEPNKTVTAYLYMQAPDHVEEKGNPYPATYNNMALAINIGVTGEDGTIRFVPQVTVTPDATTYYKVIADVPAIKVSAENEDEKIAGIRFKLSGASYYTGRQTEQYATTDTNGRLKFDEIERGTYYLEEVAATRDWVLRKTAIQILIDGYGRVWAADVDVFKTTDGEVETDRESGKPLMKDGTVAPDTYLHSTDFYGENVLTIENEPRVYADFSFYKVGKNDQRPVVGAEFSLEGRSHYDFDIYKTAKSVEEGKVTFTDVEWGTYRLTEIKTAEGYNMIPADVVIMVEVGGDRRVRIYELDPATEEEKESSDWILTSEFGDVMIADPDKYSGISFFKAERVDDGLRYLPGAVFTLKGSSDDGTAVNMESESDENGIVSFAGLEAGVYELSEKEAPKGIKINEMGLAEKGGAINYRGDTKTYNVYVNGDGSYTIREKTQDGSEGAELEKSAEGSYVFYNAPLAEGEIVITKKWVDSLTGDAAINRPFPQLTLIKAGAFASDYYTVTYNTFGGYFEAGGAKYALRYHYDELPTEEQENAVPVPRRTNYVFAGWVYRLSGEDELREFSLKDYTDKANITVYAKWRPARVWNYDYTGYVQAFTAPKTGDYLFEAWGANGGNSVGFTVRAGGKGAYTSGTVHLEAGQMIFVYVGGRGQNGYGRRQVVIIPGGWNGGGQGVSDNNWDECGAGAGGATDFRLVDGKWSDFDSLKSRIMVAAGGGGGVSTNGVPSHYGDYTSAVAGQAVSLPLSESSSFRFTFKAAISATGEYTYENGTSSVGKWYSYGSFGRGGYVNYPQYNNPHSIGGAGGGWYGGLAGSTFGGDGQWDGRHYGGTGTGGISYISGYDGCFAVDQESTEDNVQHLETSEYAGYVFSDPAIYAGYEIPAENASPSSSGAGYARITYIYQDTNESIDNYPGQTLNTAGGGGAGADEAMTSEDSTDADNEHGYWEKNSDDTWTYHFKVVDPSENYVCYEAAGLTYAIYGYVYESEEMEPGYVLLPGNTTTATVTNRLPTGSLSVSKSIAGGNISQKFKFTVTLKNSAGQPVNGVYGEVSFRNGAGVFMLADGETMLITDIPAGYTYTVSEEATENYTASFSSTSGTVTANATAEVICTNTYVPPEKIPVNVTVKKLEIGHFENAGSYEIRADFRELGAKMSYSYTVGAERYSFTSDENGTYSGLVVTLKNGESAVFEKLPIGAQYRFSEPGGEYYASYSITDEAGGTNIYQSASQASVTGIELSTMWEVADENEKVTVTFTNRLEKTLDLTVTKVVEGLNTGASFSITVLIENLEPGAAYTAVKGSDNPYVWVASEAGEIMRTISFKNGESVTVYALPVGTEYRIAEKDAAGYSPRIEINGVQTETERVGASDGFEDGIACVKQTVHEGESIDVRVINSSKMGVLKIQKEINGGFANVNAEFLFRVKLSQKSGDSETALLDVSTITVEKNGDTIDAVFSEGVLEISLGNGDVLLIEGIYDGVHYTVSEVDSGAYTVTVEGNKEGKIQSGVTAEVKFINTREAQIPTGVELSAVPGMLLILSSILGFALLLRRRKRAADR